MPCWSNVYVFAHRFTVCLEVVRLLLEAGADKDAATTTYGATALMSAAEEGHLEVVRLLLEADKDGTELAHIKQGGMRHYILTQLFKVFFHTV